VDGGDVWELLRDHLDEGEIRWIVAADLIVRGGLLPPQGEGELWLVVEVSRVIDRNDVARAAERAALLRKVPGCWSCRWQPASGLPEVR
jgi:hypothetical protein